eukprot:gene20179-7231_t
MAMPLPRHCHVKYIDTSPRRDGGSLDHIETPPLEDINSLNSVQDTPFQQLLTKDKDIGSPGK